MSKGRVREGGCMGWSKKEGKIRGGE